MKEVNFVDRGSFRGGVHPPENKSLTESLPIEKAAEPHILRIPMHANPRFSAEPIIKRGDAVLLGQKIADNSHPMGLPVHSPVSGKVIGIEDVKLASGSLVKAIVIESDGQDTLSDNVKPIENWEDMTKEEFVAVLKEAGISGMGGAEFPTHCKFVVPEDITIDTLLLNGGECEPYLTSDHRVMLERADAVIRGARIVMRAAGIPRCFIGIESNKMDAAKLIKSKLEETDDIKVKVIESKYPQGSEKHLIKSVLGRCVPPRMLPLNVGVTVMNVSTAAAIADRFDIGLPLIQKVVTVTGPAIQRPSNLMVKIGTSVRELVEQCGGFSKEPSKVLIGGPMMGFAASSLDVPIGKGSSGIVAFGKDDVEAKDPLPCIRCGRCVAHCPMRLEPSTLNQLCEAGNTEKAKKYNVIDCIECGVCSYVCPSKRHLVQSIKTVKYQIAQSRAKRRD